jgi:UDP-N-acetylmuramoyl-tripeptide--D-alanyl-D-alanine ligase
LYGFRAKPGTLFLARNEEVNTLKAARRALKRGANAAILAAPYSGNLPIYSASPNIKENIRQLAQASRSRFQGKMIAVTGSVGKTTTTQMLKHVMASHGEVYGTIGNHNTAQQTAIQLINLPQKVDFCVLETAGGGGLPRKSFLSRPHVAVVTNVGYSHMELHGSRESLAQNKFSIADHLTEDGTVVCEKASLDFAISAGAPSALRIADRTLTVGDGGHVEVLSATPNDGVLNISISVRGKPYSFSMQTTFPHYAQTAAFALGVADALGLDMGVTLAALSTYQPMVERRMERLNVEVDGGSAEIIDDAYNSSPESVRMVMSVAQTRAPRRKILVLGDMLELGSESRTIHNALAPDVQAAGFDVVMTVGEHSREIGSTLNGPVVLSFDNTDELLEPFARMLRDGDLIFLKASNGIGLDKLIAHVSSSRSVTKIQ